MRRISISIYIIVPLIFGLFSIFSFIVCFRIMEVCFARNISSVPYLWGAGLSLFGVSVLASYYILKFVLAPSEHFIRSIRMSPAIHKQGPVVGKKAKIVGSDQLAEFSKIFQEVTQALDVGDARSMFPSIIGSSQAIRGILSQVLKVASSDSTVLIRGESGTGKELIAQAIVDQSPRKWRPFVRISCGAIPPSLMESELFGHEKGAFTGAVARKKGCFEQAHTGTLFLDEIGEMPPDLQVKLLRTLQEKTLYRVGGERSVEVDVRIICATHRDLEKEMAEGRFREDLFYRINVFPLTLPPLRERREDIDLLAAHFLEIYSPGKIMGSDARECLVKRHEWPGNVRELENTIERAAVLAEGPEIGPEHLPEVFQSTRTLVRSFTTQEDAGTDSLDIDETLRKIEKILICQALDKTDGVQIRAAKLLGIKQRSLWNRVKKYEIEVERFKGGDKKQETTINKIQNQSKD